MLRRRILAPRSALFTFALTATVLLVQGCSRQDAASVAAFGEQYAQVAELQERTIAASYPYQLAETPESQAVNRTFARIRERSFSPADLDEALQAERERGWYLDHFESELKAFQEAVAELRARAEAIGDGEMRDAADAICRQFTATLESASGLLTAQRERSRHVVVFLTELISRERRFPRRAELEATGEQLQQLRDAMLQTMREPGVAFDRFRAMVESKLGLKLSPKSSFRAPVGEPGNIAKNPFARFNSPAGFP